MLTEPRGSVKTPSKVGPESSKQGNGKPETVTGPWSATSSTVCTSSEYMVWEEMMPQSRMDSTRALRRKVALAGKTSRAMLFSTSYWSLECDCYPSGELKSPSMSVLPVLTTRHDKVPGALAIRAGMKVSGNDGEGLRLR